MKPKGSVYRVLPVREMRRGDRLRVSGRRIESVETISDGRLPATQSTALTYVGGGGGVFWSDQRFGVDRPDVLAEEWLAGWTEQQLIDGHGLDRAWTFWWLQWEARSLERSALHHLCRAPRYDAWTHGYCTSARMTARSLRRLAAQVCPDRSPFQQEEKP